MFGYTIIRKDELKVLRDSFQISFRAGQCREWLSSYMDLGHIFDWVFFPTTNISDMREQYARCRGTRVYECHHSQTQINLQTAAWETSPNLGKES